MKELGLAIVEIPFGTSRKLIIDLAINGMAKVPPGRLLAVCYEMNPDFGRSEPVESIVINQVLGRAQERVGDSDWKFFGNLAIRVCSIRKNSRKVIREIGVILLCRDGDKAYVRRKSASKELLKNSTIPGIHPVFTRDVANNVWHIPARGYRGRIRNRLAALTVWADEAFLVIDPNGSRQYPVKQMNLDDDLIPVPTKQLYEWKN
jgi:hypothetical protein